MQGQADFRRSAHFFIAFGIALSFAAAVVPFFTSGHVLRLGVLLAGVLPYVVYGFLSNRERGRPLLVVGMLLIAGDLLVKIPERFLHYDGYASGLIYYWPFAATLVVALVPSIATLKARRQKSASALP